MKTDDCGAPDQTPATYDLTEEFAEWESNPDFSIPSLWAHYRGCPSPRLRRELLRILARRAEYDDSALPYLVAALGDPGAAAEHPLDSHAPDIAKVAETALERDDAEPLLLEVIRTGGAPVACPDFLKPALLRKRATWLIGRRIPQDIGSLLTTLADPVFGPTALPGLRDRARKDGQAFLDAIDPLWTSAPATVRCELIRLTPYVWRQRARCDALLVALLDDEYPEVRVCAACHILPGYGKPEATLSTAHRLSQHVNAAIQCLVSSVMGIERPEPAIRSVATLLVVLEGAREPVLNALRHVSTLPGGREAIHARISDFPESDRNEIRRVIE